MTIDEGIAKVTSMAVEYAPKVLLAIVANRHGHFTVKICNFYC